MIKHYRVALPLFQGRRIRHQSAEAWPQCFAKNEGFPHRPPSFEAVAEKCEGQAGWDRDGELVKESVAFLAKEKIGRIGLALS